MFKHYTWEETHMEAENELEDDVRNPVVFRFHFCLLIQGVPFFPQQLTLAHAKSLKGCCQN